ncbi:MAG: hypothetical protein FH757_00860 [Alcanivorax sp.]|nr:hypothetical protein [Alcanivorax sp.]
MTDKKYQLIGGLSWILILGIAFLCYLPGLSGPFLFDDFANLDALGSYGGVTSWSTFELYLNSGHSGPTGRPISLISFLVNDFSWPSSPYSFKYTNVLLHGLNGCLLLLCLLRILRYLDLTDRNILGVAITAAAVWLLHPLFVSTVLYVVQRMAILSTFFVLLGIFGYLVSRSRLRASPGQAYLGMTISLVVGTILAAFSKENGALLPSFILILELTVLCRRYAPSRAWTVIFLWAPSIIFLAYLTYVPIEQGFSSKWPHRDFSPIERLLTESRILWTYLYNLMTFQNAEGGLFFENIRISRSFFDPITTLISVIGLVLVIAVLVLFRQRLPSFALAGLFFLAGHSIESSTIGLELYFDHRNYMPSLFLFLPLVLGIHVIRDLALRAMVIMTLLGTLSFLLIIRADIWGDKSSLAIEWSQQSPSSGRAQRWAAIVLTEEGEPEKALALLNHSLVSLPESHDIAIHRIILKCSLGKSLVDDKNRLLDMAKNVDFKAKLSRLLDTFVELSLDGRCPGLTAEYAEKLILALLENPKADRSGGYRRQLFFYLGWVKAHESSGAEALDYFKRSLQLIPRVETGMRMAAILATYKNFEEAALLLTDIENLMDEGEYSYIDGDPDFYRKEIQVMKSKIQKKISDK